VRSPCCEDEARMSEVTLYYAGFSKTEDEGDYPMERMSLR
jgi:hypothetical protein